MSDTIGAQHPRAADGTDPRGLLVFDSLPDALQRAEDSTQAADFERERCWQWWSSGVWQIAGDDAAQAAYDAAETVLRAAGYTSWVGDRIRPATATERTLLAHLDYDVPDTLYAVVSFPSPGVRRRVFPQVETTEE